MTYRSTIALLLISAVKTVPPLATQAATVRDSAGIQIVDNLRPTWTASEKPHLATSPSLVIGTQAGEAYQLNRVAGAGIAPRRTRSERRCANLRTQPRCRHLSNS